MKGKRLLWQIFPPMVLVTIAALVAITWFATDFLRAFFIEQIAEDLKIRAILTQGQLLPSFRDHDFIKLNELCVTIGHKTATRITMVLPDGKVACDSDEQPLKMDNHADRQEIAAALNGETGYSIRFSQTLQQKMIYTAIPLFRGPENPKTLSGVLRLSIPLTAIDLALKEVVIKIILSALALIIIAVIITLSVSRRISRPLEEMGNKAKRFAQGFFDQKISLSNTDNDSLEVIDLARTLNEMAEQLDDRIKTVTKQRNELEAVFASLVESVIVVDPEGKVISLNKAAKKFLGSIPDAIKNRHLYEIVRNLDLQNFVENVLTTGIAIEKELIFRSNDGDVFIQAYGMRLRDAANNNVGGLIVLNDITKLRRLETIRRDFVANVSHELKTPITTIKGFVETLRDGALCNPEDTGRFLDIILKHADRLNAIVEDLLTLSRIEQEDENAEIILERNRIKPVLQGAIETCLIKAREKNIAIKLQCRDSFFANLNVPLMEQAISNLIVNAIKYSHEDSEVLVGVDKDDNGANIRVKDYGVGIAQEHLPRLFERFYRSDKARSRKLGGTGLGLAIVKHIVQSHGGRVGVESTLGKGTEFTISLPPA